MGGAVTGVPLVQSVMRGYNGTLIAYGQTAAGKTYTLGEHGMSDPIHAGLMPRMLCRLMASVQNRGVSEVRMQYVQLYLEQVFDLLVPQSAVLSLREDPQGGAFVQGAVNAQVEDEAAALDVIERGRKQLRIGSTKQNRQSSRSHAICIVTVTLRKSSPSPSMFASCDQLSVGGSRGGGGGGEGREEIGEQSGEESDEGTVFGEGVLPDVDVPNDDPKEYSRQTVNGLTRTLENANSMFKITTARLTICDLAGSERVGRVGTSGTARLEGEKINSSLLALGNVIHVLTRRSSRATHVPYRDTTLTRLLQNSLGGNCRTTLIVCVSPSLGDLSETRSSLLFGERAMLVRSHIVQNSSVDFKSLAQQLQLQLSDAEQKLADSFSRAEDRGARAIQALLKLRMARNEQLASRVDAHTLAREIEHIEDFGGERPCRVGETIEVGIPGSRLGPAVLFQTSPRFGDIGERIIDTRPLVLRVKLSESVAVPWHATFAHSVLRILGCKEAREE